MQDVEASSGIDAVYEFFKIMMGLGRASTEFENHNIGIRVEMKERLLHGCPKKQHLRLISWPCVL
jgi:hypothetical protein